MPKGCLPTATEIPSDAGGHLEAPDGHPRGIDVASVPRALECGLLVSLAGPLKTPIPQVPPLGTHPSRSYTMDETVKCLTQKSYQR